VRPVLPEIYLCRACSCQEIQDGHAPGQDAVRAADPSRLLVLPTQWAAQLLPRAAAAAAPAHAGVLISCGAASNCSPAALAGYQAPPSATARSQPCLLDSGGPSEAVLRAANTSALRHLFEDVRLAAYRRTYWGFMLSGGAAIYNLVRAVRLVCCVHRGCTRANIWVEIVRSPICRKIGGAQLGPMMNATPAQDWSYTVKHERGTATDPQATATNSGPLYQQLLSTIASFMGGLDLASMQPSSDFYRVVRLSGIRCMPCDFHPCAEPPRSQLCTALTRPVLTEIHICHACSCQEMQQRACPDTPMDIDRPHHQCRCVCGSCTPQTPSGSSSSSPSHYFGLAGRRQFALFAVEPGPHARLHLKLPSGADDWGAPDPWPARTRDPDEREAGGGGGRGHEQGGCTVTFVDPQTGSVLGVARPSAAGLAFPTGAVDTAVMVSC
jgi:hypothetical protein